MKEQIYVFVFEDGTSYEMNCGVSLKDAIYEMSKYTGNASEMFRKSLFGHKETDIDGIVALFNHFCYYSPIKIVYIVKRKLYPTADKEGDVEC